MTEGRSLPKKEEKHGRSKTNECPGYHRGTTSRKRTGGRESARAGSRSKAYCAWHTAAIYTLSLGPEREERDPPARVCTVSPGHSSPEQSPWYSIVQVLTHLPAFPSIPLPPGALSPRALLSPATCSSWASTELWSPTKCRLKRSFVGVWPWVLLLQQSYSLLEHPHLGLMSLHHGHHLRLQLLQFVLMLLLGFFIGSHQVAVRGAGKERKQTVIGLVWRHSVLSAGWLGPERSFSLYKGLGNQLFNTHGHSPVTGLTTVLSLLEACPSSLGRV